MPCVNDRRHAVDSIQLLFGQQSRRCVHKCGGGGGGIVFRMVGPGFLEVVFDSISRTPIPIIPFPRGFFFLVALGAVRTGLCIIIESQPPSAAVVVAFFDQLIYFDLPTKCRPRSQIHPVNQRISVAHMIVYRNRIPTHTSR